MEETIMEHHTDNYISSIPGGAFLVPRNILSSELWETKPAWWFKVWFYILGNANFKDHNDKLRRGDLLTSYDTLYKECNLSKEQITADAIDNVLRFFKKTGLITTRRTTRGFIITVRNYVNLQNFKSFSNGRKNGSNNDFETTHERHDKGTKGINGIKKSTKLVNPERKETQKLTPQEQDKIFDFLSKASKEDRRQRG
jgi:hypothetical protein